MWRGWGYDLFASLWDIFEFISFFSRPDSPNGPRPPVWGSSVTLRHTWLGRTNIGTSTALISETHRSTRTEPRPPFGLTWHQTRLANVTCAWSWRRCGIAPAILSVLVYSFQLFWDVTICCWVRGPKKNFWIPLNTEDKGTAFLRNVGKHELSDAVWHPRRS
jgi:hypothetical protein